MKILLTYADNIFYDVFLETINCEEYTNWSWAVSMLEYGAEDDSLYKSLVEPNKERFRHLYLTDSWGNAFYDKENFKKWKQKTADLKEALAEDSFACFFKAVQKFHPKVYFFYNDDHSVWKAFIGSMNLTHSEYSTIESVAVVSQDDDKDGTLFESIMNLFTERIPLSKNLVGNKREIKKAEKEQKTQIENQAKTSVLQFIENTIKFIEPDLSDNRNFGIISRRLKGEDMQHIATSLNLSPERIRQISKKFYAFKSSINRQLLNHPDDLKISADSYTQLKEIGSLRVYKEMKDRMSGKEKTLAEYRLDYIKFFGRIIEQISIK